MPAGTRRLGASPNPPVYGATVGVRKARNFLIVLEILVAGGAALAWNQLSRSRPGFPELSFLPYWIPSIVFASFYGPAGAYASLALGLGFVAASSWLSPEGLAAYPWRAMLNPASAFVFVAVSAIGFGRLAKLDAERSMRGRYAAAYKEKLRLRRTLEAVKVVNAYYERQLLSAQDSLPLLHEHLRGLNTRSVPEFSQGLLVLTERFSSVHSGAVYRYDRLSDRLSLVARSGQSPAPEERPLEGSIEGWVFRNAARFTLRQVVDDQYLAGMDDGRVVMAYPLVSGEETWGVFAVLDLPFVSYTEANERAISAMLELAKPYLERAIRFERLAREADFDRDAGYPSYSQFLAMVDDAFARGFGAPFSIVLCQIDNMREILQEAGPGAELACAQAVSKAFSQADAPMEICQYKRLDQVAIFVRGLHEDGVSRLSLEALAKLQSDPPTIGDKPIRLDIRVGFASRRKTDESSEAMTGRAELLIEMQG